MRQVWVWWVLRRRSSLEGIGQRRRLPALWQLWNSPLAEEKQRERLRRHQRSTASVIVAVCWCLVLVLPCRAVTYLWLYQGDCLQRLFDTLDRAC